MQLSLTEEQVQFQDVVTRFLAEKSDAAAVRRQIGSECGFDLAVWGRLCSDLGLPGTHIPEEYGGFGFGDVELGIVMQAMGRRLYTGPFLASAVMAAYAILNAASEEQKRRLLGEIANGSVIAALALDNWNCPEGVGNGVSAERNGQEYLLNGMATAFVDAKSANLLVVAARTTGGAVSLFVLDAKSTGVGARSLDAIDHSRRISRFDFSNAPAELLGAEGSAQLERLWDQMSVMLAFEMIGGAEELFYSTVDYTKIRVQFGRPIGSFQALKHRCADLLVDLELAKAAVQYAGQWLASGNGDAHAPNMAKAMASDVYVKVAHAAIQLRGGIGFTWEDDTHFWFKRAKSSEVLLGNSDWHRERMMQRIEGASHVC